MFVADQVILMLFALTGCGLLICFSPSLTGQQTNSLGPFWLISVGSFSISFCLFASISVVDPIIQTLANFFNLVSFAFCALLFRSWRVRIARHLTTSAWAGLVICALLYEQLRLQGSFYDRVIFVNLLMLVLLFWQGSELAHLCRQKKSKILWASLILIVLQISALTARMVSMAITDSTLATSILSEDIAMRLWRWIAITINSLRFFLIGAYFLAERMSEQRARLIAIASNEKRISTELREKETLRELLSERDTLLGALLIAQKTAEAGKLFNLLGDKLKQLSYVMQAKSSLLHKALFTSQENDARLQAQQISRIISSTQRAANIIATLQIIVLKKTYAPERLDLCIYMQSKKTRLLMLLHQKNISLDIQYDELSSIFVSLNPQEFESALINILNSAVAAFDNSSIAEKRILFEIKRTETHAQLIVMNNGDALDPDSMRAPNPLLSLNSNTNTNLWLSEHVIKKNGGHIWLANRRHWSTALLIELPLS